MANPTTSLKSLSFTVDPVTDGYEHYYAITSAGVIVTLPLDMPLHHRFLVRCQADTQFEDSGNLIVVPEDKVLQPFGGYAVIGFTVIGTNVIDSFGDMIDQRYSNA